MQSLLGEAIPMVYRKPGGSVAMSAPNRACLHQPTQPHGLGNACSHSYRKRQSSTIAPGELLLPSATPTIVELT